MWRGLYNEFWHMFKPFYHYESGNSENLNLSSSFFFCQKEFYSENEIHPLIISLCTLRSQPYALIWTINIDKVGLSEKTHELKVDQANHEVQYRNSSLYLLSSPSGEYQLLKLPVHLTIHIVWPGARLKICLELGWLICSI